MKTFAAFSALLLAGGLPAQVSQTTTFERQVQVTTAGSPPEAGTFRFVAAGAALEGKVVKGAPYSAQGITETVRVLADGTRIVQKSTSKVYRDSDGRTRREHTLGTIGEWTSAGSAPTTITIHDPVAGAIYLLNPAEKTARKIRVSVEAQVVSQSGGGQKREEEVVRNVLLPAPAMAAWFERRQSGEGRGEGTFFGGAFPGERVMLLGPDAKEESLGQRTVEGVLAQGTRVTNTIPAGRIGNDRPITIVHERWHSPELDVTILTESKDPMSGDVTYRLTNIQRGDPPASLFEVPPDYKVDEGGSIQRRLRLVEQTESEKR